jgi:hypothetical protein
MGPGVRIGRGHVALPTPPHPHPATSLAPVCPHLGHVEPSLFIGDGDHDGDHTVPGACSPLTEPAAGDLTVPGSA